MEKYCKSCGSVFKDSDFIICPYCGNQLYTRKCGQPISKKPHHQLFERENYYSISCGATNKLFELYVNYSKPIAKGVTNDLNNLQILCDQCHTTKRDDNQVEGNTQKFNTHKVKNDPINKYDNYSPDSIKYETQKRMDKERYLKRDQKLKEKYGTKICPKCKKEVLKNAIRCKYCKHYFSKFHENKSRDLSGINKIRSDKNNENTKNKKIQINQGINQFEVLPGVASKISDAIHIFKQEKPEIYEIYEIIKHKEHFLIKYGNPSEVIKSNNFSLWNRGSPRPKLKRCIIKHEKSFWDENISNIKYCSKCGAEMDRISILSYKCPYCNSTKFIKVLKIKYNAPTSSNIEINERRALLDMIDDYCYLEEYGEWYFEEDNYDNYDDDSEIVFLRTGSSRKAIRLTVEELRKWYKNMNK